ncbi:olfactory receptor 1M1-like [Mantella aurantiaca]
MVYGIHERCRQEAGQLASPKWSSAKEGGGGLFRVVALQKSIKELRQKPKGQGRRYDVQILRSGMLEEPSSQIASRREAGVSTVTLRVMIIIFFKLSIFSTLGLLPEDHMANHTVPSEMTLVGFPSLPEEYHCWIATIMFFTYMISLTANGTVVGLVSFNEHLHQPMYLFIANLAASNLLFDTVTLPKAIARYWFGASTINFRICLFQIFLVHYFGSLDSYLLLLMAADRYVAICHPLRYVSIVTNQVVTISCGICWIILATSTNTAVAILAAQIPLCGANKINSLFCGYTAFAILACTDISSSKKVVFLCALVVLLVPLGLILVSYLRIIVTVSLTRSESLQKAFYTCVNHLLVIALYYTPRLFVYIVSNIPSVTITSDLSAVLLFLYSFVPHMANPIIYFLLTKEIAQTLRQMLNRRKFRVNA